MWIGNGVNRLYGSFFTLVSASVTAGQGFRDAAGRLLETAIVEQR